MYEDKLKKELLSKINQWREINEEICEIESGSDLPIPDLFEDNDNYAGLIIESMDLQDEISALLVDSKYAPLTMLSRSQIQDIDFFLQLTDSSSEQNIEKHLEAQLLNTRDEMKKRIQQAPHLSLGFDIPPKIKNLYRQAIKCYVNGAYEASCVLSRTIAENIIRIKCKDEYRAIYDLLKKIHNPKLKSLYEEIAKKANKILHESNEKTEEKDALKAIKLLRLFIKNFK